MAAVFANAVAFTVTSAMLPALLPQPGLKILVPIAFCAVGVILAGAALRASLRRKRFGPTSFDFASLPFSPGRSLRGTIQLRFNTEARHGIDLRLSCVREVITGSGDQRSTNRMILWEVEKNVPQESLTRGPMGDAQIPVDFGIPSDAYETNHDQPSDQVLWLLHAQADVPGVNYSDDFEVPVFRLTPSPGSASEPTTAFSNETESETAPPAFQSDASDVAAPPKPKVRVTTAMDGSTHFYFPACRNPVQILILILFTALWTGIVYFLAHSHAPWFFAPVFGFFDLFLIYGLVQATLVSFAIEVGNGRMVLRRSVLGTGAPREVPFSGIARILAVTSIQQGTPASYSIRLQTRDGKNLTLADSITNRQEARWVTAQLEKLASLKLDTHVAVEAGLAGYGSPPQRGEAPSAALRRSSPVAMAVGIAFFLGWIGFMGYGFFSLRHGHPHRVSNVTPAARSLQPVNYSALTDTDVRRLQALPEQTQAEELLDRAIQHDPRALDLFEQRIGVWLGDIKLTEHMKQLEWRSRFSTDLRVRYANADLNLAMDGWPRNENSADLLISRAQTDPEHRAYDVYYMGMLAGRGVAYNRIYPVLVNYARNDADPQVRLWAVEGMRFLGTDEALEQLFDSFTHDASDAVRDRAGCNLSDCGIFKRTQRMRMAPRLIDLAADAQTNPQMRNWAFLALQEITDESLPANASSWQEWYRQHGADKIAEFEKLDWWRVRGDQ